MEGTTNIFGGRVGSPTSDDDGSGADYADWGSEQEDAPVRSLVSSAVLPSLTAVFAELKTETGFDFDLFATSSSLGTYDRLKLANYIRHAQLAAPSGEPAAVTAALRHVLSPAILGAIDPSWKQEKWLQPALEDDGLIMAVLAALDDEDDEQGDLDGGVREALMSASAIASAAADFQDGGGAALTAAAALASSLRAAKVAEDGPGAASSAAATPGPSSAAAGVAAAPNASSAGVSASASESATLRALKGELADLQEQLRNAHAALLVSRQLLLAQAGVDEDGVGEEEDVESGDGDGCCEEPEGGSHSCDGAACRHGSHGGSAPAAATAETAVSRVHAVSGEGKPAKRKLSDDESASALDASQGAGDAAGQEGQRGGRGGKLSSSARRPRGTALTASSGSSSSSKVPAPLKAASRSGGGGQDNDTYYFDSYAAAGIHAEMLGDAVRTDAYRDAIVALVGAEAAARREAAVAAAAAAASTAAAAASPVVVLDVGCGTGILSMFAARAGLQQQPPFAAAAAGAAPSSSSPSPPPGVVAVAVGIDASGIIEDARAIVAANGLSASVHLLRGKAEEVDVPAAVAAAVAAAGGAPGPGATVAGDRPAAAGGAAAGGSSSQLRVRVPCVDVLVSEWMGYALLYESMLSSVLVTRDRYLKAGGLMLPSKASIVVAGVSDPALWRRRVSFWEDVYGFNMRAMKRHLFHEPLVQVLPPESVATTSACVRRLDLLTMADADQDIVDAPFTLAWTGRGGGGGASTAAQQTAEEEGEGSAVEGGERVLHGLSVWFDMAFDDARFDPAAAAAAAAAGGGAGGAASVTAAAVAGSGGGAGWAVDDDDIPSLESNAAAASAPPPAMAAASPAAAAAAAAEPRVAVSFSTAPAATPTHWCQTLLLFAQPVHVPAAGGGALSGVLTMARDGRNPREFRFSVRLAAAATAAAGSGDAAAGGATPQRRVLLSQSYHMR